MRLLLLLDWLVYGSSVSAAAISLSSWQRSDQKLLSPAYGPSTPKFPHHPSGRPTGFAAFGDSYSTGIGTGLDGGEDECRRGLGAHPQLILQDLVATKGPEKNTTFQFLSCTGATVDDVLAGSESSQVDGFDATLAADFALLSIGGNDLSFFEVMNACVFRFYSFYSDTCESALASAERRIGSHEFDRLVEMAIMEILDKVRWEKKPWFIVTVTGYARFFNAETPECDECSLSIWWPAPKLRRELRRRMNDVVIAVNSKIRQSVAAINARFADPKVFFVDYDARFDGHRFCEPGVTEPDYARNETWFFLAGGQDNNASATWHHSTSSRADSWPPGTGDGSVAAALPLSVASPLIDPSTCLGPAQRSGDWGELALCYMAMAKARDPTLRLARTDGGTGAAEDSMWHVPTYYAKSFHPRTVGHRAIRDEVYATWASLGY